MDLNTIITAALSGAFASLGTYLVLRANRPLVAAQADSVEADADGKRATARGTELANAKLVIELYEKRMTDSEARLTKVEEVERAKDVAQAEREKALNDRIDSLLVLGGKQGEAYARLEASGQKRTELIERQRDESELNFAKIDKLEMLVLALKEEIGALIEQLKGLGHNPGEKAVEKAAGVRAAENK